MPVRSMARALTSGGLALVLALGGVFLPATAGEAERPTDAMVVEEQDPAPVDEMDDSGASAASDSGLDGAEVSVENVIPEAAAAEPVDAEPSTDAPNASSLEGDETPVKTDAVPDSPVATGAAILWGVDGNPVSYHRPGNHQVNGDVSKLLPSGPYLFDADPESVSWSTESASGELVVDGDLKVGYSINVAVNLTGLKVSVADGKGTISAGRDVAIAYFDLSNVQPQTAADGKLVTYRDVPVFATGQAGNHIKYYAAYGAYGQRLADSRLAPLTLQIAFDGLPTDIAPPVTAPFVHWNAPASTPLAPADVAEDYVINYYGSGFYDSQADATFVGVIEAGKWSVGDGAPSPQIVAYRTELTQLTEGSENPAGFYGRVVGSLTIPAGTLLPGREYQVITWGAGTTDYDTATETGSFATTGSRAHELTSASIVWAVDGNPATYHRPGNHVTTGSVSKLLHSGPYRFDADAEADRTQWAYGEDSGTVSVDGTLVVGYSINVAIRLTNPVFTVNDGSGVITTGNGVEVATFDLTGVTPELAADGTVVTYRDVPVTAIGNAGNVIKHYDARGAYGDRNENPALAPLTLTLAYDGAVPDIQQPQTWPYAMWYQGQSALPQTIESGEENAIDAFGSGFIDAQPGQVLLGIVPAGSWSPGEGVPDALAITAASLEEELSETPSGFYGRIGGSLTIPAGTLRSDTSYDLITFAEDTRAYDSVGRSIRTAISTDPELPVPEITVSERTDLDREGQRVVVTGTGFVPNAPATDGTGEMAGAFGGVIVSFGNFAPQWRPSQEAPSSTRAIDPSASVWLLPASQLTPERQQAGAQLLNADGSFQVTLNVSADFTANLPGGESRYGIATYPGGGATYAAFENLQLVTFTPADDDDDDDTTTPGTGLSVSVSPASNLDWTVDNTLRLQGTGFISPVPSTEGIYLTVIEKGTWKPGEIPEREVALHPIVVKEEIRDGRFDLRYTIPAGLLEPGKEYEIATFAAHGASRTDRSLDSLTPIQLRQPEGAIITVTPSRNLSSESTTRVTVAGQGFAADSAGINLHLGWIQDHWQPSKGAKASSRNSIDSIHIGGSSRIKWTVEEDGTASFSATMTVSRAALDKQELLGGKPAIYTVSAARAASAQQESAAVLTFAAVPPTGGPDGSGGSAGSGSKPGTGDLAQQVGTFTWGIKESFRTYIGGTAQGRFVTTGVSTSGGLFTFTQTGGAYDHDTRTGLVTYGGSVQAWGHGGQLHYELSNWRIRYNGSSADVIVDFRNLGTGGAPSKSNVTIARLDLSRAGASTASDGTRRYTNAPATAVDAYSIFTNYGAGTPLDSATIVIGAAGGASTTTRVVGSADGARSSQWTPPAEAPASSGLTILTTEELVAGGQISIEGSGFRPNEADIKVVVYSDPVILATDVKADANGVARWSGLLPISLEPGEHIITMQGSTSVGSPITVGEAVQDAPVCTIESAELTWGFKESFRSYISGNASGEWILEGGTEYETPTFRWASAAGGLESQSDDAIGTGIVTFAGSIQFVGHRGALDMTVYDPAIEIIGEDTAYLLLGVKGMTREGRDTDTAAVRFATIDLSHAVRDGGRISVREAAVTLTAEGEQAFGTYPEGTELDPVSFAFTLDGCGDVTAPVDDGIDDDVANPVAPISTTAVSASSDSGMSTTMLVTLLLVALVVGGVGGGYVVRRQLTKTA